MKQSYCVHTAEVLFTICSMFVFLKNSLNLFSHVLLNTLMSILWGSCSMFARLSSQFVLVLCWTFTNDWTFTMFTNSSVQYTVTCIESWCRIRTFVAWICCYLVWTICVTKYLTNYLRRKSYFKRDQEHQKRVQEPMLGLFQNVLLVITVHYHSE